MCAYQITMKCTFPFILQSLDLTTDIVVGQSNKQKVIFLKNLKPERAFLICNPYFCANYGNTEKRYI